MYQAIPVLRIAWEDIDDDDVDSGNHLSDGGWGAVGGLIGKRAETGRGPTSSFLARYLAHWAFVP